jgi:two-component system response regulator NreC
MNRQINIAIAEDHALYREVIIKTLHHYGINCVGEANNGKELLKLLKTNQEIIVLLDLEMPETNGKEALFEIQTAFPLVKILIISQYDDQNIIDHFNKLGVQGYLPKGYLSGDLEILAKAIRNIDLGMKYFVYHGNNRGYVKYSNRELELIPLICDGRTTKEIADTLGVKVKTIEKHRRKLFEKTNSRNMASLIKFSIKKGLDFLGVNKR